MCIENLLILNSFCFKDISFSKNNVLYIKVIEICGFASYICLNIPFKSYNSVHRLYSIMWVYKVIKIDISFYLA
jgi:hypothetical protein